MSSKTPSSDDISFGSVVVDMEESYPQKDNVFYTQDPTPSDETQTLVFPKNVLEATLNSGSDQNKQEIPSHVVPSNVGTSHVVPSNVGTSAGVPLFGFARLRSSKKPKQPHYQTTAEDILSSPKNIKCTDIESALGKSYINYTNSHPSSNALDVLALYIKGQKLLYTEAKTYCEQQLNFLMLPAIFISCVGSIFSFVSDKYNYGPVIIACLNGFNAFLLALISYLKLDAKAQAHKTSAYKFDKLESYCEFNSGKFMFFEAQIDDIFAVVEKIEKDVKEIKETNQFILPESIRYEFHFTYSTNVFMMIKRMHSREMAEIHNLKNCMNQLALLKPQLDAETNRQPTNSDEIKEIRYKIETENIRKTELVNSILLRRNEYYELDNRFKTEIEYHMRRANKWFIFRIICCDWLKS
jgi:hypothetical protein